MQIHIANAFSSRPFTGNPAAVIVLDEPIDSELMQNIAEQNNLSETAFVNRSPDGHGLRGLRWFTPAREVRMCGHATLATAYVLGEQLQLGENFDFDTLSGRLSCKKVLQGWQLDFPADEAIPAPDVQDIAEAAIGQRLREDQVFVGIDDAMIVLDSPEQVVNYRPNEHEISRIPKRGLIITAQANANDDFHIISRCFYPEFGIVEDPVTGSAHTLLVPYWSQRLTQERLVCQQASRRGGVLYAHYQGGSRVLLTGAAELYLKGEISV